LLIKIHAVPTAGASFHEFLQDGYPLRAIRCNISPNLHTETIERQVLLPKKVNFMLSCHIILMEWYLLDGAFTIIEDA
jgi:hypothetical protein